MYAISKYATIYFSILYMYYLKWCSKACNEQNKLNSCCQVASVIAVFFAKNITQLENYS